MLSNKVRNFLTELCEKTGGHVAFDVPLNGRSTIAIGGTAAAWFVPSSPEALREAKIFLDDLGVRIIVIGNASNVLMPDEGLDAVVVSLSADFFKEKIFGKRMVSARAGVNLGDLISDCCARGLAGLEGLAGIPATIGGALVMNAGYRSLISDHLLSVRVLDGDGNFRWMDRKNIGFGYRVSSFDKSDIIVEAVFRLDEKPPDSLKEILKRYFSEKMARQPLEKKTLGSIFKNPPDTEFKSAELIDSADMKGSRRGGAEVSEKHANFIVNTGNASSRDVIGLIDEIRAVVREKFSVELEPEIEIL